MAPEPARDKRRSAATLASAIVAGFVGAKVTVLASWSGPVAPALGVAAAALAADVTGNIIDKAGGRTSFGYPFQPTENDYDVEAIQQAAAPTNLKKSALKLLKKYDLRTTDGAKEMLIAGTIGAADNVSATTHLEKYLSFFRLSTEFTETLQGKIKRVHDLSQKLSARRLQKRAA